jgi:predicted nucleic acid-binding protein
VGAIARKRKESGFRVDCLVREGHPLSCTFDMDVLIAAFCKTYDLTLVTNNTKHFENIAGLRLADWSAVKNGLT